MVLIIIIGCQQYLDRFTWRHDSILNFIAKSLQPVINVHSSLSANGNGFLNPSVITGENYRPDLLFLIQSKCLYVLEWTVGLESNLNNNAVREKEKYLNLIKEISRNYKCVKFVNLSMELPWRFLPQMPRVLAHDEWHWHWQKAATLYNKKWWLNSSFTYIPLLSFLCMLYFILLHFQTFYKFLTYFYTLHIYVLILLTSYLLENDRRSAEMLFLLRDFYCGKF